jgi:hypothetical protein
VEERLAPWARLPDRRQIDVPIYFLNRSSAGSEQAIGWLMALMVLCCDPLAIALTAAASREAVL